MSNIHWNGCLNLGQGTLNVWWYPVSYLNCKKNENVKSLEIFGMVFEDDSSGSQTGSMDKRTDMKCGWSLYGLRDMSYPGMSSDVKAYIWSPNISQFCSMVLIVFHVIKPGYTN